MLIPSNTNLSRQRVTFPAVTVCNLNMLKKSLLNQTQYEGLITADVDVQEEIERRRQEYLNYRRIKRNVLISNDVNENSLGFDENIDWMVADELQYAGPAGGSVSRDRRNADDGSGGEPFIYTDYGFEGIENDFEFNKFAEASQTGDLSDLADVLKPTWRDLERYGHTAEEFILQCSFDKGHCDYM